jgi:hypothetical protein
MPVHTVGGHLVIQFPTMENAVLKTDPRFDGFKAPIGSKGYGNLKNGFIQSYTKVGSGDTDWQVDADTYNKLNAWQYPDVVVVDETAIPGSEVQVATVDGGLPQFFGMSFVQVQCNAYQIQSPSGSSPEGANWDGCIINKSFGLLLRDDNSQFLSEVQTDQEFYMNGDGTIATGGGGDTNDREMDVIITSVSAGNTAIKVINGTDNGGGDSGRTLEWQVRYRISTPGNNF